MLTELFNMCLKESCFPDCWKVLPVVTVCENVGERFMAKNYGPVSLLSAGFENLVIIGLLITAINLASSVFQYGLRFSPLTPDLTVVSGRIARAFNRPGFSRAVALDTPKAFDRRWQAGLPHKLESFGI